MIKRAVEPGRIRIAQTQARRVFASARVDTFPVDVSIVAAHLDLQIVPRLFPASERTSGALLRRPDGAVIIVNKSHSVVRRRFTVAHEIGHYVLHDDELHVDRFRDDRSETGTDAKEVEANAFAAELLMPEAVLRKEVPPMELLDLDADAQETIARLARRFGVSAQAMTWRLSNISLLG